MIKMGNEFEAIAFLTFISVIKTVLISTIPLWAKKHESYCLQSRSIFKINDFGSPHFFKVLKENPK